MKLYPIMLVAPYHEGASSIEQARLVGQPFLVVGIPWEMIAPHSKQAYRNHSQTLEELAQRGGLEASEALAVLRSKSWVEMPNGVANKELYDMTVEWIASRERENSV